MKLSSFYKVLLIIIVLVIIPVNVKANIICNDGTTSKTCMDCHRGCCSGHGGCSSGYSNSGSSGSSNNYNSSSNSNNSYNYTAPVIREKSSNNKIKAITIDNKAIAVKEKMSYVTTNSEVTIKVALESSVATADYNSTKYLDHGNNNETISVTAEDGTSKIYYLDIKKINNNTNIKEIKVDGSSVSLENMKYNAYSEEIDLEVIPEDEYAKADYDKKIKLKEGSNEIPITIVAENEDKKEYRLIIDYDPTGGIITGVLTLGGIGGATAAGIHHIKKKKKAS